MRKWVRGTLVWAAALAASVGVRDAGAQVLYDNGAPGSGGIEVTIRVLAEDVVLGENATVERVRIWAIEDLDAWSGTIEYFFFDDDGGAPADSAFASGLGQTISVVGNQYTFGLETPVALQAGVTYWVGIHMDDDYDDGTDCCVFWSTLAGGAQMGSGAASATAGFFDNWGITPNHHAFQLLPEPGSAAAGMAALLLVAVIRRGGATGRRRA